MFEVSGTDKLAPRYMHNPCRGTELTRVRLLRYALSAGCSTVASTGSLVRGHRTSDMLTGTFTNKQALRSVGSTELHTKLASVRAGASKPFGAVL